MAKSIVAPNPFLNSLVNSVSLKEDTRVQLVLIDMAARIVASKETKLNKGNLQVVMNELGTLTAGSYVLNTTINGVKTAAQLLIKQ